MSYYLRFFARYALPWVPALLNIDQPNLHTLASVHAHPLAELLYFANMDSPDDTNGSLGRSLMLNFCAALRPIYYTSRYKQFELVTLSTPNSLLSLIPIISFVLTYPCPGRLLLVISSPCPARPEPRHRPQGKLQRCCCASLENYSQGVCFRPLRRGGNLHSCFKHCATICLRCFLNRQGRTG